MRVELIARTGAVFHDFQPYVPAIDDTGRVAFEARLAAGGSGVFLGEGGEVATLFRDDGGLVPCSHPDRNELGDGAVYARRADGSSALLGFGPEGSRVLVDSRAGELSGIGPLGPVIDGDGCIAFRAVLPGSRAAICRWQGGAFSIDAVAGQEFTAFHGLPVTAGKAGLLFRADRADGRQGLYRCAGGPTECLALTGQGFRELSAFPAMNSRGEVAVGTTEEGGAPVLLHRCGGMERRIRPAPGDGIRGFRGALLAEGGALFCAADTVDGGVAVFALRDGALRRVLGTGDHCLGGTLAGFALNPVSVNAAGQLAIRLLFADGGQAIARLSPEPADNL